MKSKGSTFVLVLTVMLFAIVMTLAGLTVFMKTSDYVIVKQGEEEPVEPEVDYHLSKFESIDNLISNSYLKNYSRDDQMEAVYREMLNSLEDPYSRYLSAEELKQLQLNINSAFMGTGIVFVKQDGEGEEGYLINEVIPGGPAFVAGLQEGDIIVKVEGKTVETSEKLMEILKGDPGTKVDFEILRDEVPMEFSIIRGEVTGVSVDSKQIKNENIGYIKIRSFGDETYGVFESAISGYEASGVDGLIIDLRDNSGGLFDEGIKVIDRILPECLITYTVDKTGEKENYNSDDRKTNLKLAVLVNENTASTAEMIAAAIKTNKCGTIVGTKTYGKGLIQENHVYEDGSAVNLTTKEFFISGDIKVDGEGVVPDEMVINSSGSTDAQLEKAIKIIKGK